MWLIVPQFDFGTEHQFSDLLEREVPEDGMLRLDFLPLSYKSFKACKRNR